ncbi:hypothetical protein LSH36_3128g00007 [Paralvinella palmiformis]|uniref:Uncharacterized protein n=1 Tax=Paralvinella palmiformis TaxID=53620 RepID=A0AAD9IP04_9ANNE|nr:hypothetical protein LSH36_3128g00007 [Paralvinella palmiformis]
MSIPGSRRMSTYSEVVLTTIIYIIMTYYMCSIQ